MVREWARVYSQASVVLVGGGPPCQGVGGLNADRRGTLKNEQSKLFTHVPRILALVRKAFSWCQVHGLMESVASMDKDDRDAMSGEFGCERWRCDAASMTWCSRPRLYWMTWEIRRFGRWSLSPSRIKEGWIKHDCQRAFPTFTTSRPRSTRERACAGLTQCDRRMWPDGHLTCTAILLLSMPKRTYASGAQVSYGFPQFKNSSWDFH